MSILMVVQLVGIILCWTAAAVCLIAAWLNWTVFRHYRRVTERLEQDEWLHKLREPQLKSLDPATDYMGDPTPRG